MSMSPSLSKATKGIFWIGPTQCAAVRLTPPPLPPRKVRRILPALLGQHVPFPVEECDIAFEPLPDGAVMGFAARRSAVDALLAERRAADSAAPEHLVPAAWALWNHALRALPPASPDERRAVLCDSGATLLAILGRGNALETSAELPADAAASAALALGPDAAAVRCLCVGARAAVLADAARGAGAAPVVPENAGDFLERACVESIRRGGADLLADRVPTGPSGRLLAAFAVLLIAASAALFIGTDRAIARAKAHAADLNDELSGRVDFVAGYHVTAKGERAISIARQAAADVRSAEAQTLERLLSPGASAVLADTLESATAHGIRLFHLSIDDAGPALSSDAPDRASADAFADELQRRGHPVRLEPEPGPRAAGERLRFMATPLSTTAP